MKLRISARAARLSFTIMLAFLRNTALNRLGLHHNYSQICKFPLTHRPSGREFQLAAVAAGVKFPTPLFQNMGGGGGGGVGGGIFVISHVV